MKLNSEPLPRPVIALLLALALAIGICAGMATPSPGADRGVAGMGGALVYDRGDGTGGLYTESFNGFPWDATPVTGSSGNVAAATAAASLPGVAGRTNYVCGFALTSGGATAAATVNVTLTGVITGTMTFNHGAQTGAGVPSSPTIVSFSRCVPASAANTAITVSMPSLGTGNTNASANIWGFLK